MYREIGDLFNFHGQRIGRVGMMKTELYTMFEVELPHYSTIFHSIDTARYYVGLYGFHIRLNCVLT